MVVEKGALLRLVADEEQQHLKELIVDLTAPSFNEDRVATSSQMTKRDYDLMNEDQRRVLQKIAETNDYLLVHGMPGTGKTTTIALIVSYICFLHLYALQSLFACICCVYRFKHLLLMGIVF